jgi:hypothetical protein
MRSKIFFARGIAFYSDNQLDDAKDALNVARRYNDTQDIDDEIKLVDDALARKKP